MVGKAIKLPVINKLAIKYQKTPAQTILRWIHQKNVVVNPKSNSTERIVENIKIFDFVLSEEDMAMIDALNKNASLVKNRDRIVWLMEMLWKSKFN